LIVTLEHYPDKVLEIIQRNEETYEWFKNAWIHLAVIHPKSKEIFVFKNESFQPYWVMPGQNPKVQDVVQESIQSTENLPIYQIA